MTETEYIEKTSVVELLKKLGHRVIDVPGENSCYDALVVINGDEETILRYLNGGVLQ